MSLQCLCLGDVVLVYAYMIFYVTLAVHPIWRVLELVQFFGSRSKQCQPTQPIQDLESFVGHS